MKIKIPSLKSNFSSEIIERGYDYYKQGRVKNLIIDGEKAKAVVVGNRNYRVTIDLTKSYFKCTCPYGFNCKHEVAVIYELRKNKYVETGDNIKNQLIKKPKEELIAILYKILTLNPKFKKFLSNKTEDIKKAINSIDMNEDEDIDEFVGDVDDIYDLIMQQPEKLDNMVTLFKKCFKIWDNFGGVEPLEDSMFMILEAISKEAKKLPKEDRQPLIQEITDLVGEFDFFLDSMDFRG